MKRSELLQTAGVLCWLFGGAAAVQAQNPAVSVAVGDPVVAAPGGPGVAPFVVAPGVGRLGSPKPSAAANAAEQALAAPPQLFEQTPPDTDRDDRAIRQVTDDGALILADAAGTALLQLAGGQVAIWLDPTARDPVDGIGLARLLRAEVSHGGSSAILALRADNLEGIYRLESGHLTRLALVPDNRNRAPIDPDPGDGELAISDTGQIAYVARSSSFTGGAAGALTVFRDRAGAGSQPLALGPLLAGATMETVSNLQSNASGELVFLLGLREPNGDQDQAVVRVSPAGATVVARTGEVVEREPGAGSTMALGLLRRPRIGPDGTVAFYGGDSPFPLAANFFRARPGTPGLEPLLPGSRWNLDLDPQAFDLEVDAGGTAAVRARSGTFGPSTLYGVAPDGTVSALSGALQPQGRPLFGPGGRLFFLAADPALPADPTGRPRVGLYRSRLVNGRPSGGPEPVAIPGQAVPGEAGTSLLGVTERPTLSPQGLALELQFGTAGPAESPTTGFFQVPLDGTLTGDGRLLADEGAPLNGGNRLALLRDLSYRADGTLVFGGLQPGSSSLVAAVPAATTAGKVRTQSETRPPVAPLLTTGDDLGSGRRLLAILGPPFGLGPDRELLAAHFSQDNGVDGEGLFAVDRQKQVQPVAVTSGPGGTAGVAFAGFTDPASAAVAAPTDCSALSLPAEPQSVGMPSVAAAGSGINVVFKARLDPAGGSSFGLFQWTGAGVDAVALANSDLAALPRDGPPYALLRWAADRSGTAYLLARPVGGPTRLFRRSGKRLEPLVVPGQTPVQGAPPLSDLSDFVVAGDGTAYVLGTAASLPGLYRVTAAGLTPVALPNQPIPPFADGREAEVKGLSFGRRFGLMPDSTRGALLWRADVVSSNGTTRRGLFRLDPLRGLETLLVESVGVAGARNLTVEQLADSLDQQSTNGTTVFASFSQADGWMLYRSHLNPDGTSFTTQLLAQEARGQPHTGVPQFTTLDPSLLLDLPCHSGPIFSLNDSGGVALLASNGQRWGLYLFPAP